MLGSGEIGGHPDMGMKASRFTQADVARVIRAMRQCGANMKIVINSDGEIRIVSMGTTTAPGKARVDFNGDINL
jgi:hypothetical protein